VINSRIQGCPINVNKYPEIKTKYDVKRQKHDDIYKMGVKHKQIAEIEIMTSQ